MERDEKIAELGSRKIINIGPVFGPGSGTGSAVPTDPDLGLVKLDPRIRVRIRILFLKTDPGPGPPGPDPDPTRWHPYSSLSIIDALLINYTFVDVHSHQSFNRALLFKNTCESLFITKTC